MILENDLGAQDLHQGQYIEFPLTSSTNLSYNLFSASHASFICDVNEPIDLFLLYLYRSLWNVEKNRLHKWGLYQSISLPEFPSLSSKYQTKPTVIPCTKLLFRDTYRPLVYNHVPSTVVRIISNYYCFTCDLVFYMWPSVLHVASNSLNSKGNLFIEK